MKPVSLPQQIQELLIESLVSQDPQIQVKIQRNTFGWLRPYIVTSLFNKKNLEERKEQINTIIAGLNLHLDDYPFVDYHLLTPQEAAKCSYPVQMPLWSETLLAPDSPVTIDEINDKRPFVVTFYSFKGGVGRSTALAFVANILATSGYRVVIIDFDLKAPGLSLANADRLPEADTHGVLDYIFQRYLIPEANIPAINECIRQISISGRGELFLVPAGAYSERYIHLLADLEVRSLYQSDINSIHQLLQEVKESLKPDVILIDASTGFAEIGAVALFEQADLGIICFFPSKQNYAGLEWVVEGAKKQRKYNGIPDLRFLLTPIAD